MNNLRNLCNVLNLDYKDIKLMPDESINQYFNIITGWYEDVDIEKCDNVSPIQVLNKSFPTHDIKI